MPGVSSGFDITRLIRVNEEIINTQKELITRMGEKIHLYGRITELADVFDALGSERVYKKAWPLEQVLELMKEQSGRHFDPQLVKLFQQNLSIFLNIKR